jgi:hypothetical protein
MIKRRFKAKSRTALGIIPVKKDKYYQKSLVRSKEQFALDKYIIKEIDMCSFIRPFVPGEMDGFELPEEIDDIKWVYVLAPGSMSHVREHMKLLPTHTGAIMFDIVEGKRVHARILLNEEQKDAILASAKEVIVGQVINES